MLKGAIFDMDGLMFDTERIWQEHWNELAKERGLELPVAFRQEICGTVGEDMMKVLRKFYQTDDAEPIANECRTRVYQTMDLGIPEKIGLREILEFFKRNQIKMAVASSTRLPQIQKNLKNANIEDYFEVVVSGHQVNRGKPYPDIFLKAAEDLGLQPQDCYVLEDAFNGIKAAYAAGCKAIMVPDMTNPTKEIEEMCYLICASLLEVIKELEKE